MCNNPKPKVPKPIKQPKIAKPHFEEKKKKVQDNKDVYYDKTDGSFNVPIAGIKKYDHKPGKNIVTLNNLKNKPETKKEESNIVTLDSLKGKPQEKKKINGKRDLLGSLQDAASDEPMPCMRKQIADRYKGLEN